MAGLSETPTAVQPYFNIHDELSIQNGFIFRGDRVVVPDSMRQDMLRKIRRPYIGTEGCLRRARDLLYWPGINAEAKDFISGCDICRSLDDKLCKDTSISHEVPIWPWAKVACNLFALNGKDYIVTMDYFSNF